MSEARVTIKDVAASAGVSEAAVSLAVNGRPGLSAPTRARILATARALGWEGRPRSRSGRRARAPGARGGTVAMAVSRPARQLGLEPFYMRFISGIENVLAERSDTLMLRLVRSLDEEIDLQRRWWKDGRVIGSVLVDLRENDLRVPTLAQIGMPAVAIGHPSLTGPFAALWTDDATAVAEAVRYLAALGHRTIARVAGSAGLGHTAIRSTAFAATARKLGVTTTAQVATDFSSEHGVRATRILLTSAAPPTAIVYDNDLMAVAGLSVAADLGLRVPDDVSLLAWDDSELCRLAHPALSAMRHDVAAFGAEAARTLYRVLEGERVTSRQAPTPALTPRGSTAPPPR